MLCEYVTLASGMIFKFVTKQTFKQFQPLIVTKNHNTILLYIEYINFLSPYLAPISTMTLNFR